MRSMNVNINIPVWPSSFILNIIKMVVGGSLSHTDMQPGQKNSTWITRHLPRSCTDTHAFPPAPFYHLITSQLSSEMSKLPHVLVLGLCVHLFYGSICNNWRNVFCQKWINCLSYLVNVVFPALHLMRQAYLLSLTLSRLCIFNNPGWWSALVLRSEGVHQPQRPLLGSCTSTFGKDQEPTQYTWTPWTPLHTLSLQRYSG